MMPNNPILRAALVPHREVLDVIKLLAQIIS